MFGWSNKKKVRRRQVRGQRVRSAASTRLPWTRRVASWRVLSALVFIAAAFGIALLGEATPNYAIGQRVDQPIYARVDFQVANPQQTEANRRAARAATPSYYKRNASALTVDRIRADLRRLYQVAAAADTFEAFEAAVKEHDWPADPSAYRELRRLADRPNEVGQKQFEDWVVRLPLEREYVARGVARESRDPRSTTDYIILQTTNEQGEPEDIKIDLSRVVGQGNEKALRGSAADVAKSVPSYELRQTVEAIVFAAFREQPTIIFDQERTVEHMRKAAEATPEAMTSYERGKPLISPGELGREELALINAEHAAYLRFLTKDNPTAVKLRRGRLLSHVGLVTLISVLSIGLLVYTNAHQPRIFQNRTRTIAFGVLIIGTLLAVRLLDLRWGHIPEFMFVPCLISGSVLAIVYPRRFAIGAMCIVAVLVTTTVRGDLVFLLSLFVGVTVAAYQLDEVRARTKLITSGVITALTLMIASAAGGLMQSFSTDSLDFILEHAMLAGACAILASFVISGVLPFIERTFRIATALSLLEWRDPTQPLLQLLAREAPGTYNHSLVLGTLAEAACERIGANGLLAQVGALYHDIGKIPKADYFAENQTGQINRHDKLAPTMSLLIIVGHVKDGLEMAKEYKLPRVLHQFIGEHHGTTVVRYFHHVASEKQPQIASGKHDREVRESEFRYGGPKPGTRESAVVMMCDGVESAVRALAEPTVGRIEQVVHAIVTDRLNDGQFDDCDITLKEIRQVRDSLVKSLCSIYHGRVTYPKAPKSQDEPAAQRRISV